MTQVAGFGRDTWCGANGLQTGRYASGNTLLAQALYRRLITPRGTLRGGDGEANYGLDLADFIGAVGDTAAAVAIPGMVQAELAKDERVLSVSVRVASTATDSAGLVSLTIAVDVTPADEGDSFTLTLAASAVSVDLLGVSS